MNQLTEWLHSSPSRIVRLNETLEAFGWLAYMYNVHFQNAIFNKTSNECIQMKENKSTSKQEKHGRLQTVTISSKGAFPSNKYEHVNDKPLCSGCSWNTRIVRSLLQQTWAGTLPHWTRWKMIEHRIQNNICSNCWSQPRSA